MYWPKKSREEIKERVFGALQQNENYDANTILGIPGTYLDTEEFHHDAPFLNDAPYLSTLVANPNHIGCHTLNKDKSEAIFRGTQRIEIELIELLATEVFKASPETIDGYVAPGGTEANIQALWIYRNYFMQQHNAKAEQIALIHSADSHYSMPKGANLLNIHEAQINVHEQNREWDLQHLDYELGRLKAEGVGYFIIVLNMATTMFGSVDQPDPIVEVFERHNVPFKLHVDAAFGGFIYPFTAGEVNPLNFCHAAVSSITLDAHKMLQAPFGTGIFLCRKGLMRYAGTDAAQYVPGLDYTICGSRSGANVIAVWMILMTYGSKGWKKKLHGLLALTEKVTRALDEHQIAYYREPFMNIIAIRAEDISDYIAHRFRLVADSYEQKPKWWKIVVMPHVKAEALSQFIHAVVEDRAIHFTK